MSAIELFKLSRSGNNLVLSSISEQILTACAAAVGKRAYKQRPHGSVGPGQFQATFRHASTEVADVHMSRGGRSTADGSMLTLTALQIALVSPTNSTFVANRAFNNTDLTE
ncbi:MULTISPECIES: hypothetical protein [unclassified Dietzia]|uniref:hypothetical protein n=1 Tax=unclassified Dietzia TaxID=2617939 RepID=UPI0015F88C3F|nr:MULTISPECIES: hypothetical protein [unclassified Dietzia]MBB1052532.1 hypothetical protein [Dietzia sp. CW19]MBB1055672.1 hypothetical protein [Dietzia sp. B44]